MNYTHTLCATLLALGTFPALAAGDFTLSSPDIRAGESIQGENYWNNFGCSGANEMPALAWKNAPKNTKSFAVTFYDKDAPTGSGFWHWVAYNLPADATGLGGGVDGGRLPPGAIEGMTDVGKPGFAGPCPPVGRRHTYVFTVHALKVDKLEVPAGAPAALTGFFIHMNTLAKATLPVKAGPRK